MKMQLKHYIALSILPLVGAYLSSDRDRFVSDFLDIYEKPGYLSLVTNKIPHENIRLSKHLHRSGRFFKIIANVNTNDNKNVSTKCSRMKPCNPDNIDDVAEENVDNVVYLVDLRGVDRNILKKAEKLNSLVNPARWILLYDVKSKKPKEEIELLLADVYVAVNTEVYVVFMYSEDFQIFLVYKRRPDLPIIWEDYSIWHNSTGFNRPHPANALALRRKCQEKMDIHASAVIAGNDSLDNMPNYQKRHVNTMTKISYWMTVHLFEWLNATGHIHVIKSPEKIKHNGTLDGIAKELYYGYSDFSGSLLVPIKEHLPAITYIASPAAADAYVILKKPSLASVGNIYTLPFSIGVWIALALLIVVSSLTLCFTSSREEELLNRHAASTLSQRISQGFHDTLCMVFQQGTADDPVSLSSREILFLGLLSFMFLFTAYSANIVALLQSATNDINSVEKLLNSPLTCGAQDTEFNRVMFEEEDRPVYRSFWLKKAVPQGDQFFLSVEEGIRRMREGMYAFVVDPTAGNDQVKATFYELEKCNIGTFKYTQSIRPHIGVAKRSRLKEILRIGVLRIIESGVQSRSSRRVLSSIPPCGVGTAMFTAVSLTHVAPAYRWIATLYVVAVGLLAVEIAVYKRSRGWVN